MYIPPSSQRCVLSQPRCQVPQVLGHLRDGDSAHYDHVPFNAGKWAPAVCLAELIADRQTALRFYVQIGREALDAFAESKLIFTHSFHPSAPAMPVALQPVDVCLPPSLIRQTGA